MYRRGPLDFVIVPRGFAGWVQLVAWFALLGALIVWFAGYAEKNGESDDFAFAIILFLIGLIGWAIIAMCWVLARAKVVEMAEYLRERQKAEQKRRRSNRDMPPQ